MGLFSKLKEGLTKTRNNIVSGIDNIFSGFSSIDDDFYEELEETLIMGDIGVRATDEIIEELKSKVKENKIKDPKDCKQLLIDTIREKMNLGPNAYDFENQKSIVMLIGVNGVGKTTSIGKIANRMKNAGKKVIAVTRLAKYGEHIDDHQIQNNEAFGANKYVIPVYEIEDLEKAFKSIEDGTADLIPWENKDPMAIINLIDNFIKQNWN